MDEKKSVYAVVTDEQMARVRGALEDVTELIDSLRRGCEIAYRREPTQAEGDAHANRHDQSMGPSYSESFVPMGGHRGWKCKCGVWVWGGPTVCQRCVDTDAVKLALEETARWRSAAESQNAQWAKKCTELTEERARAEQLQEELDRDEAAKFLSLLALGGTIVSSSTLTPEQIAIARSLDRLFVNADGFGYVYRPAPRCATDEGQLDELHALAIEALP